MCRLLGFVSPTAATPRSAVGAREIDEFLALATLHRDGWGIATVARPGDDPQVEVRAYGADSDPEFAAAMDGRPVCAGLVHLRWASAGIPVATVNTHPFLADGLAFAHNGSMPRDVVRTLLHPAIAAGLHGQTDSELYFALLRQNLDAAGSVAGAAGLAATAIGRLCPARSLNALVLDADQLVAVHVSATARLDREDQEACEASGLPAAHTEDYFRLRLRRSATGLAIGSTGFGRDEWVPLAPNSVTAVRLTDLTVSTAELDLPTVVSV